MCRSLGLPGLRPSSAEFRPAERIKCSGWTLAGKLLLVGHDVGVHPVAALNALADRPNDCLSCQLEPVGGKVQTNQTIRTAGGAKDHDHHCVT